MFYKEKYLSWKDRLKEIEEQMDVKKNKFTE
jgi:hypothetical protein